MYVNIPYFRYQNDSYKKKYSLGDFGNKTPTHMGAAHAISKIEQKFQNRIPRELDKNFDSPRISSNFFEIKKSPT